MHTICETWVALPVNRLGDHKDQNGDSLSVTVLLAAALSQSSLELTALCFFLL